MHPRADVNAERKRCGANLGSMSAMDGVAKIQSEKILVGAGFVVFEKLENNILRFREFLVLVLLLFMVFEIPCWSFYSFGILW